MKNRKSDSGFAKRLKELRETKSLSQTELAKLVGIHYMHMSRYERGLSRPSADTLKRLAEALGVTGDYLIEGDAGDVAATQMVDRDLLALFLEVEAFPAEEKVTVKKVLTALVNQQRLQVMASGAQKATTR